MSSHSPYKLLRAYLRLASVSYIDTSSQPDVTLFTWPSPHQVIVLFFSRPKKHIEVSNPASIHEVIETEAFWSPDERTQQLGRLIHLRRLWFVNVNIFSTSCEDKRIRLLLENSRCRARSGQPWKIVFFFSDWITLHFCLTVHNFYFFFKKQPFLVLTRWTAFANAKRT